MMEGMPLRPLLSFVPGIKREMLEQMVGALNEGVAYNKKKCINGNESLMPDQKVDNLVKSCLWMLHRRNGQNRKI